MKTNDNPTGNPVEKFTAAIIRELWFTEEEDKHNERDDYCTEHLSHMKFTSREGLVNFLNMFGTNETR